MPKMPKSRTTRRSSSKTSSENTIPDDPQCSLEDWLSLTQSNLALKCSQYGLKSKGKKEDLAKLLLVHFGSGETSQNKENSEPTANKVPGVVLPTPGAQLSSVTNVDGTLLCEAIATLQEQQKLQQAQQNSIQTCLQQLLDKGSNDNANLPAFGNNPNPNIPVETAILGSPHQAGAQNLVTYQPGSAPQAHTVQAALPSTHQIIQPQPQAAMMSPQVSETLPAAANQ